jgi:hypothetical protein
LAGLLLIAPILLLAILVLANRAGAAGWFLILVGIYSLLTAYSIGSTWNVGRARWALVGLAIAIAAFQFYAGYNLLISKLG